MSYYPTERQEMAPFYGYPGQYPVQNQAQYPAQTPAQNPGQYPVQAPPQFPTQLQVPTQAGAALNNQAVPGMPLGAMPDVAVNPTPADGMLPLEQSYVENILRFNRGKMANVYMTFEYNPEWPAKVFRGIIEEAGRDHLILSNPNTKEHYLLLMVNLDYVEFEEPIEYITPALPGYVTTVPGR